VADESKQFAVLTGDIVKSSSLIAAQLESVRECVLGAVEQARGWQRGTVKGRAEFYRGDAWQVLVGEVSRALRIAVLIRASLIAQGIADTRISVGLGSVENLSRTRVSLSTGQAFVLSGHGLENMSHHCRLSIEAARAEPLAGWLKTAVRLTDAVISRWKSRQAEIVVAALSPNEPTHEQIAHSLSPAISRQSVSKSLESADWPAVQQCLVQFEQTALSERTS